MLANLGQRPTSPKVTGVAKFPSLAENNVRQGFLEDEAYYALVDGAELGFRALVECGRTYAWRVQELLSMRVRQVDLAQRAFA